MASFALRPLARSMAAGSRAVRHAHAASAPGAAALTSDAPAVDPFGHAGQAEGYAAFRPSYPQALLRHLWERPGATGGLAVDACCGTGKLTAALAPHFRLVLGIDRSGEQLRHADRTAANVAYVEADAAALEGVAEGAADLVAIAQGLHWLDVPSFCAAARRALRPGGHLAVLGYGICSLQAGGSLEAAFESYYLGTLGAHLPLGHPGNFWDCDRKLLDAGFSDTHFPHFGAVQRHWHRETSRMPLDDFSGYLRTWSAYRRYLAERPSAEDPVDALRSQLAAAGCAERGVDVTLPYFLVLARAE